MPSAAARRRCSRERPVAFPIQQEDDRSVTIQSIYGGWRLYNDLVADALGAMSTDELALRAPSTDPSSSTSWPIWAIAGHTAGTRVYWLCTVMGVLGAESTPFKDAAHGGWEDDLGHPRSGEELVTAWTTTWAIVERALESWTPDTLDDAVVRGGGDEARHFTRRSLLLRLITHEAYHAGEIAVIQGIHGRPQIDLWPPDYHTIEAAAARATP
jgi:uncharacterized damage-inducible protein DinB